jgi:purine-nucleoside phosphorylase
VSREKEKPKPEKPKPEAPAPQKSVAVEPGTGKGSPNDLFSRADRAAKFVLSQTKLQPRIALVLGSGLGAFADEFENAARIPYAKIPGFPVSTAVGHAGQMVIGTVSGVAVAAMQGRVHFYEGYTMAEVTFPMRVLGRMGIKAVILTNAAGGINRNYKQGSLVVLRDHINLQGTNPLIGANDERLGLRFPDMSKAYSRKLGDAARAEGQKLGMVVYEGIYAALSGPSYETPAEIHYLRTIGADLVGMSTVPETIAARHLGMQVLGISCVTNPAAGILDKPLDHKEVLETGERVKGQFIALLRAVIPRIAEEVK